MNVEQLSSLSKEDLANAFRAEQERLYAARQARCEGLERKIAELDEHRRACERLQLQSWEIQQVLDILSEYGSTVNLEEKLHPAIYAKLKSAEPIMDEVFPEMASKPEVKKFRHVLRLCEKVIQSEFQIYMWERQIEKFKNKTPDDMKIQDPALKILTKWGSDPGKDTSRLYGKELAGVLWSPFIFRRHIPGMFKKLVRTNTLPSRGDVRTVVTGLLKLGKNNPWFALDSQLFSDKPTPEERWNDIYDRLDYNDYILFKDYIKVGYYYTKRDELAFSERAIKEDLIVASKRILAMSWSEVKNSALAEYQNSNGFDGPKARVDFGGDFDGGANGLGAAIFSAFGPKA